MAFITKNKKLKELCEKCDTKEAVYFVDESFLSCRECIKDRLDRYYKVVIEVFINFSKRRRK